MTQPLPLDKRIDAASRMAFKARQFWSLFLLTKSQEGHKAHRRVFNDYWEAIRFIQAACRDAALIELHSLFADHRSTVNLPRVIREVEAMGLQMSEARRLQDTVIANLSKIKILRDSALAHRTKLVEFNDVFRKADITYAEVGRTADVAVSIVNELRRARGLDREEVSPLPLETFDRMLVSLRLPTWDGSV